jgi:hypothetical protein
MPKNCREYITGRLDARFPFLYPDRLGGGGQMEAPYTPPKLSPEEEREQREMVTWHAQKGLHFAQQALERANSNREREAAIKEIQMFTEMLERNKEK